MEYALTVNFTYVISRMRHGTIVMSRKDKFEGINCVPQGTISAFVFED
jgi:hypothetical protein